LVFDQVIRQFRFNIAAKQVLQAKAIAGNRTPKDRSAIEEYAGGTPAL
jgi:hypothetical protein